MSKLPLFGILKHKISIWANVSNNDMEQDDWQRQYTTFAAILPLFDNKIGMIENFSFGNIVTEGYFLFKVRCCYNITNKMRIKFKDRIFQIKRIIDVTESGKWLKIIALEIDNN